MVSDFNIYKAILQNENIKSEFHEYIRIIVQTIADESYPYIYVVIFFVVLNFLLIVATLILVILK